MATHATAHVGNFPWWFLPCFVVGWFSILALLSVMSGWALLSRRFRAKGPSPSGSRHFVSGRLGGVRFRSSLTVGQSATGLYLAVFFIFRPFNPPLLIPWTAILRHPRRKQGWFSTYDSLEINGGAGSVELRLYGNVAGDFEQFLPASLP